MWTIEKDGQKGKRHGCLRRSDSESSQSSIFIESVAPVPHGFSFSFLSFLLPSNNDEEIYTGTAKAEAYNSWFVFPLLSFICSNFSYMPSLIKYT